MKALADYVHSQGTEVRHLLRRRDQDLRGAGPGSNGYEEHDAQPYAAWGVDYLKYDWCNTEGQDTRDAYARMSRALRSHRPADRLQHLRVGQHASPGRGPRASATCGARPATSRTAGTAAGSGAAWASSTSSTSGRLEPYAGPGHWNDPDMLEVGNGGMTRRIPRPLQPLVPPGRAAHGRQRPRRP